MAWPTLSHSLHNNNNNQREVPSFHHALKLCLWLGPQTAISQKHRLWIDLVILLHHFIFFTVKNFYLKWHTRLIRVFISVENTIGQRNNHLQYKVFPAALTRNSHHDTLFFWFCILPCRWRWSVPSTVSWHLQNATYVVQNLMFRKTSYKVNLWI